MSSHPVQPGLVLRTLLTAYALAWGTSLVGCGSESAQKHQPLEDAGVDAEVDAGGDSAPVCELASADATSVDFLKRLGCKQDFDALASVPVDTSIPGARAVKVVLDMADNEALYFLNTETYPFHYWFVSKHLSGNGLPLVPELWKFNETEYYKPNRRFVLASVTHYEGPDLWVLEFSPYDTAPAEFIERMMGALSISTYFASELAFHPTSAAQAQTAKQLSSHIRVVTTDEIFAQTEYQPLTLGRAKGRLHFVKAADLATEYLSYRDIIVLDEVPNDISVVSGLITEQFQTPLSHVNVLSQNRKTPNMGLRGATTNEKLRALEGKWVDLIVRATEWTIEEITMAEADEYWEEKRPTPIVLPAPDLSVTELADCESIVDMSGLSLSLRERIKDAVNAYGGKVAHYSVLAQLPDVPVRKAFGIPVYYYNQFMQENGFFEQIDALLEDSAFKADPAVRDQKLKELRDAIKLAPVNQDFQDKLKQKLDADYPNQSMRFRSSTNSEDLEGFPCAGCYESHTGAANDLAHMLSAIRKTWATIWLFRTFEERAYYGVDHKSVSMALLVHHNFPDEEANGVALTANPYDPLGLEPAFYVNVQWGGDAEVVHPPPGVTTDEFLYFFSAPNRPITYLSRSNLVPAGESVLNSRQAYELGKALDVIHSAFSPVYGPASGNSGWYAMDIEFKFDDEGLTEPALYIKQARPHPGRGNSAE